MKKYKTANGTVATESELREYYGDKFDNMLSDGLFTDVDEPKEEIYITANGSEATKSELIEYYGVVDFTRS